MRTLFRQFMFGASIGNDKVMNIGWLLFRIHVGLSIAIHAGWPKLNSLGAPGWFTQQVAGLGFTFPSPAFWATISVWGEFAGGILIAIGLFTRFAAIQLAFQFFIIAFLWYEEPEPLTGMYFQHLLFWAFVLVSFGGGGRYSLDRLILIRKKIRSAATRIAMASLLLCVGINTHAQSATANISDFKFLQGNWEGSLTYEDYSSHTTEKIKATANIKLEEESSFLLAIGYPDEPAMNGKDKYTIAKNGASINNKKVIERTLQPDGILKIIVEERGEDGNDHQPATFHHVWMISSKKFTLTKLVKFDTGNNFFQRNQYVFSR